MRFAEETVEGHSFPRLFIAEAAHHPRTKNLYARIAIRANGTSEQANKRLLIAAKA
jgi:hypothetical protein